MYKVCEWVVEGVLSQIRSLLSSYFKDLQNHQENACAQAWFYRELKYKSFKFVLKKAGKDFIRVLSLIFHKVFKIFLFRTLPNI